MTARHQQVADDLRRLILSGALPVDSRLPPETQLATRYRVSTPTLREALELLRAEGLVEKFQGRGNYVRRPPRRLIYPGPGDGLHVIVSAADIKAPPELAARLRARPNSPTTEYVCLSHRDDSPQSLAHLYVPRRAAHADPPPTCSSPWGDDLLTAAGVTVDSSNDQVTARFPTAAEAQSLRIPTRTPVLAVERTFTTHDGRVAAYALLVLPGDRAEIAFISRNDKKAEA
ncbi:GntR family transcriptional regulator [Streptomyces sp. NBC_01190]|uniref:GntR family transcriptional regulator n=1 Tax=Streptomyces sp. NBC_01190 TaxID=2903767 RepID=UPI003869D5E4|nr:GntR family transcriptional regulator [Streptomyces sp. NBC_01190]